METEEPTVQRGKIALLFGLIVLIGSLITFKFVEGLSWFDSLYFIVVTLSTVGYGDIAPGKTLTKSIVIIMIIVGISTLAILGNIALDRAIKSRLQPSYELTSSLDHLSEHIILVGYDSVAENIATFTRERLMPVLVISKIRDDVTRARGHGIEAYVADSTDPYVLDRLGLDQARAMYLFNKDEEDVIQTSILASKIEERLSIFARTQKHVGIDYGALLGITRTYHHERMIASFIRISLREVNTLVYPNQDVPNSRIRMVMVNDASRVKTFGQSVIIGSINDNLTHFTSIEEQIKQPAQLKSASNYLIAMPLELNKDKLSSDMGEEQLRFEHIIIGGYSAQVRDILEHLEFDKSSIRVICFSKQDHELASADGYQSQYCNRKELDKLVREWIGDDDLVVNLFQSTTDSLLLNVLIAQEECNPEILQLARYDHEVEVFLRSGASRVITPGMLLSRAMFLILLAEIRRPISLIYANAHIFEHYIAATDKFANKTPDELKEMGYTLLAYLPAKSTKLTRVPPTGELRPGDNVILYQSHELMSKQISH